MKKTQACSLLLLTAALAVMAVDHFAAPLPDWAVRTTGVVMLLSLVCTAYSTVKGIVDK